MDRRMVMLAVTYANCSGATKRDGSAFSSEDFMPSKNGHADAFGNIQTAEQKIAILQAFTQTYAAKHAGRIERGARIG